MPLRWDPLLVRHLAVELDRVLSGARVRALRLEGDARRFTLLLPEATLDWSLHPSRGEPLLLPAADPDPRDLPLPARIRQVRSEPDERVLIFELLPTRGRPGRDLVVELLGNQWNALVVERPSGTLRHVLVRRGAPRPARVGLAYAPPDTDTALRQGHALWSSLAFGDAPPSPVLRQARGDGQPYPWALPGLGGAPVGSLLEAFRIRAQAGGGAASASTGVPDVSPELLAELESAWDARLRKATRLQADLDALEDEGALRAAADLLLARLSQVPPAAARAVLQGFDGGEVTLELDPTLPAAANAEALYERAARAARARARLPALLDDATRQARALETLLARARSGEAGGDEVRAALPRRSERPAQAGEAEPLPYRVFRSSGGLEIRVGRGARFNDDLTFHHAAPGDVWLHARHAAGAHVVLRWGKPGNPPHRDLEEAAGLAALHSKARTSGVVPVDWTLRKHVRKPRGSPPGTVVPERVRTLMVRPDAALLEKLAAEP